MHQKIPIIPNIPKVCITLEKRMNLRWWTFSSNVKKNISGHITQFVLLSMTFVWILGVGNGVDITIALRPHKRFSTDVFERIQTRKVNLTLLRSNFCCPTHLFLPTQTAHMMKSLSQTPIFKIPLNPRPLLLYIWEQAPQLSTFPPLLLLFVTVFLSPIINFYY